MSHSDTALSEIETLRRLRRHRPRLQEFDEGQHVVVLVQLVARGLAANDQGENILRIVSTVQTHRGSPWSVVRWRTIPTSARREKPES